MELRVGDKVMEHFEQCMVTLCYNAVGSAFSFNYLYEEGNSEHREIFRPARYVGAEVRHKGEVVITGVALGNRSVKAPVRQLRQLSGYSLGGVLEDCTLESTVSGGEGTQFDGLSLVQIVSKVIRPFGIGLSVDKSVRAEADVVYTSVKIEPDELVKDFIDRLASQRNIILSHNEKGDLLLTRADTGKAPLYHFEDGMPGVSIELYFDGQKMNDEITVLQQENPTGGNVGNSKIVNPYLDRTKGPTAVGGYSPLYRPLTVIQTSGNDNQTAKTARNILGQQLRAAIQLHIRMAGWNLNRKLVRPNNNITVKSPENSLYQKTKFFIETVVFELTEEKAEVCTLVCTVPEAYNTDTVVNIFTGTNITAPYVAPGAHAVITPFDQI